MSHRKLAASIIGEIGSNHCRGFNVLRHQVGRLQLTVDEHILSEVLLYDDEDLTIEQAMSVIKKERERELPRQC